MYIRYVVCNRCDKKIENPHPDRITIHKHETETYVTHFKEEKTKSVYKTAQTLHLCDECNAKFHQFLTEVPHDADRN